jgi:hypothetical protein
VWDHFNNEKGGVLGGVIIIPAGCKDGCSISDCKKSCDGSDACRGFNYVFHEDSKTSCTYLSRTDEDGRTEALGSTVFVSIASDSAEEEAKTVQPSNLDEDVSDPRVRKSQLKTDAPYIVTYGAHATSGAVFVSLDNFPFKKELESDDCGLLWDIRPTGLPYDFFEYYIVPKVAEPNPVHAQVKAVFDHPEDLLLKKAAPKHMCQASYMLQATLAEGSAALSLLKKTGSLEVEVVRGTGAAAQSQANITLRDPRVAAGVTRPGHGLVMCTPFNPNFNGVDEFRSWLGYHLLAGVDHFHIYDWSTMAWESEKITAFMAVLAPLRRKGIVSYHPLMQAQKQVERTDNNAMELIAHWDCMMRSRDGAAEWVINTHIDEFLLNGAGSWEEGFLKPLLAKVPASVDAVALYELGARQDGLLADGLFLDVAKSKPEIPSLPWTRFVTCCNANFSVHTSTGTLSETTHWRTESECGGGWQTCDRALQHQKDEHGQQTAGRPLYWDEFHPISQPYQEFVRPDECSHWGVFSCFYTSTTGRKKRKEISRDVTRVLTDWSALAVAHFSKPTWGEINYHTNPKEWAKLFEQPHGHVRGLARPLGTKLDYGPFYEPPADGTGCMKPEPASWHGVTAIFGSINISACIRSVLAADGALPSGVGSWSALDACAPSKH